MAAQVKKIIENKDKSLFLISNDDCSGGESSVTKVDISTLPDAPARVKVNKLFYSIRGAAVELFYDRSSAIRIAVLSGDGSLDLGMEGGLEDTGTGGTGDIKLSTLAPATPSSYSILIGFKADAS